MRKQQQQQQSKAKAVYEAGKYVGSKRKEHTARVLRPTTLAFPSVTNTKVQQGEEQQKTF